MFGGKVKINNIKVKPVDIPKIDESKIKGYKLFAEPYANIFLCAKKKSGKTSVLFKILKECATKETKIVIFASTVFKDPTYKAIIKYFKEQEIMVIPKTHYNENGVNELDQLIKTLEQQNPEEMEEEKPKQKPKKFLSFEGDEDEEEVKKRKSRKVAAEYIFVFDDLSTDMRSKSISAILKKNRHFKSKCIISSQAWMDVDLQARQQLDYCLLFGGHPQEKLETIWRDLDLSITLEEFLKLYYDATSEKYHFLYVDARGETYRKDFNLEFIVSN